MGTELFERSISDHLEHGPVAVGRLLKVPEGSLDFYDFEEYEQLVTAAAKTSGNAHLIVLLAGEAGLRAGEMRALEWSDVNFQKRQLRVERQ
jgi:integrase